MTSMSIILADELDIDWKDVVVEQADFFPERYDRQFTGGSQGIRQGGSLFVLLVPLRDKCSLMQLLNPGRFLQAKLPQRQECYRTKLTEKKSAMANLRLWLLHSPYRRWELPQFDALRLACFARTDVQKF